jgi:hypothetical protein
MSAAANAAGFLYASGRLRKNNDMTRHVETPKEPVKIIRKPRPKLLEPKP